MELQFHLILVFLGWQVWFSHIRRKFRSAAFATWVATVNKMQIDRQEELRLPLNTSHCQ